MDKPRVYMGTLAPSWASDKHIKYITFSVTDECNLRCTYCYFTHKTHKNVMSFEVARKAIDDILTESMYDSFDGVVWDFIGGEPTIEMGLIDKISDYALYKMYQLNHKWLYCYRFMIGSNGLLYDSDDVQRYINKHRGNIFVAITIDGSKEKHDLSRVKKDGSGSYDDVRRIIPLWQKQFGGENTKATFSHDDLPFLKDSIINLWNMGIKCVAANVVFEDAWQAGDAEIYKQQLYELANYIIENDLWDQYSVRFFDPVVGTPYTDENMRRNFCGTGTMMAINTEGDYYPCVRFMPSATNNHTFQRIGSVDTKIDPDRVRAFFALSTKNQSSQKCLECDIAGGCTWCSGVNFDCSSIGTLYDRQMYICEMHKANVEVNKYLWRQYELKKHRISPYRYSKLTNISPYNKYLYIICDNSFPSYCEYSLNDTLPKSVMSEGMLAKVITFCDDNNFVPVFCGCEKLPDNYYGYQMISYDDITIGRCKIHANYFTQLLLSVNNVTRECNLPNVSNVILTYDASDLDTLIEKIELLSEKVPHVSVNLTIQKMNIGVEDYLTRYNSFLIKLLELTGSKWKAGNYLTVNVIANELFANTNRPCGAGKNSYTMSPDGNIYLCAGFYYSDPSHPIGNVISGIDNIYSKQCDMDKAPICEGCGIRHCRRCVYKNKQGTGEYHIPTELQCVISHMEYEYSRKLSELLNEGGLSVPIEYNKKLVKNEHYDPMLSIRGEEYPNHGYDRFIHKLGL